MTGLAAIGTGDAILVVVAIEDPLDGKEIPAVVAIADEITHGDRVVEGGEVVGESLQGSHVSHMAPTFMGFKFALRHENPSLRLHAEDVIVERFHRPVRAVSSSDVAITCNVASQASPNPVL